MQQLNIPTEIGNHLNNCPIDRIMQVIYLI